MNDFLEFFLAADGLNPVTVSIHAGQVTIGRVVQSTTFTDDGQKVIGDQFGHIVGFARSSTDERIIEVKWEDGTVQPIHPANVRLHF